MDKAKVYNKLYLGTGHRSWSSKEIQNFLVISPTSSEHKLKVCLKTYQVSQKKT